MAVPAGEIVVKPTPTAFLASFSAAVNSNLRTTATILSRRACRDRPVGLEHAQTPLRESSCRFFVSAWSFSSDDDQTRSKVRSDKH